MAFPCGHPRPPPIQPAPLAFSVASRAGSDWEYYSTAFSIAPGAVYHKQHIIDEVSCKKKVIADPLNCLNNAHVQATCPRHAVLAPGRTKKEQLANTIYRTTGLSTDDLLAVLPGACDVIEEYGMLTPPTQEEE